MSTSEEQMFSGMVRVAGLTLAVIAAAACAAVPAPTRSAQPSATPSCPTAVFGKPCVSSPAPAPTPTLGPIAYVQPGRFQFVDSLHGWVQGNACDAAGHCVPGFARTEDGGSTWTLLPEPAKQGGFRFMSSVVGYAFDQGVSKTEDGGTTWRDLGFPRQAPVTDVFSFAGSIWALTACGAGGGTCTPVLWRETSPAGAFEKAASQPPGVLPCSPGAGSRVLRQLVAGPWLVLYSDQPGVGADCFNVYAVTSNGDSWSTLTSPCPAPVDGQVFGGAPTGLLMDICMAGAATDMVPKEAWVSADGGRHWSLRSSSGLVPGGETTGNIPLIGGSNDLAMPTSLDFWMSLWRNDLYETHDGGKTWTPSAVPGQFLGDAGGAGQVLFLDRWRGWAAGPEGLYATVDGHSWHRVNIIGPVAGYTGT